MLLFVFLQFLYNFFFIIFVTDMILILSMLVPLKNFMFSTCHACPQLRPRDLHILPPLPLWLVQVVHNLFHFFISFRHHRDQPVVTASHISPR
ncbi:hypothetical protein Hanom_Chr07g00611631 [Helianthus anomalus]